VAAAVVVPVWDIAMTDTPQEFVVHDHPVWRERANFIVHAELAETDRPKRFEQLWVRQLGGDRFEVCCIPFFVYDLALGDVVVTSPKHGRNYVVRKVVKPSGRYVYRVWFGQSFHPRDEIAGELKALGSLIEWSSRNLLAVDTADGEHAQLVADFLMERERAGHLVYETGRSLSDGAAPITTCPASGPRTRLRTGSLERGSVGCR
jgi:hypothetical protein